MILAGELAQLDDGWEPVTNQIRVKRRVPERN
jgi:hypothetical protein